MKGSFAMERALAEADAAAVRGEVPVGAALVDAGSGAIIAADGNRVEQLGDATAHAEMLLLRRGARRFGRWRLAGCDLYVTLEPCPMCAGLIVNARVGRVVYGTDDPKAGACRSLFELTTDARLNHRVELITGVRAEESAEMLRSFFRARRAKGCDA